MVGVKNFQNQNLNLNQNLKLKLNTTDLKLELYNLLSLFYFSDSRNDKQHKQDKGARFFREYFWTSGLVAGHPWGLGGNKRAVLYNKAVQHFFWSAITIPSDDLFKDDFCNDKRIALLQHTDVLCIRVVK